MIKDRDFIFIVMRHSNENGTDIPVGCFRTLERCVEVSDAYNQEMSDRGITEVTFTTAITDYNDS